MANACSAVMDGKLLRVPPDVPTKIYNQFQLTALIVGSDLVVFDNAGKVALRADGNLSRATKLVASSVRRLSTSDLRAVAASLSA